MKLLLVANRAPDRQGPGDAKLGFATVKALTDAGHQVSLVVLEPDAVPRRALQTLRALLGGKPLQIGMTSSSAAHRRIPALATQEPPDVVIAVHARAAAHVPATLRPRGLALIIDAYGRNYQTYAGRVSKPLELVYRMEQHRMDRLERRFVVEFARTAVVSELDRAYLKEFGSDPAAVVRLTYAVDLDFFAQTRRKPSLEAPVFAFLGRLSYLPNRDAVLWLAAELWPALRTRWPQARMRVIGARPDRRLRRTLDAAGIELVADAPDIRPCFEDVLTLLAPMRMGGGIQTKILEAMAARVPVIATSFASRGIAARPEHELLTADTPADYVRQAERLVEDPRLAPEIVGAGRSFVETQHAPALFDRELLATCEAIAAQAQQQSSRIMGRT